MVYIGIKIFSFFHSIDLVVPELAIVGQNLLLQAVLHRLISLTQILYVYMFLLYLIFHYTSQKVKI